MPQSSAFIIPKSLPPHHTQTHSLAHQPTKPPKMKFSIILAVLPVALAAPGTLAAPKTVTAREVAARADGCAELVSLNHPPSKEKEEKKPQ